MFVNIYLAKNPRVMSDETKIKISEGMKRNLITKKGGAVKLPLK